MSQAEDLNVVIKCLIELGEKKNFDISDIEARVKAITPRIKPILFEKGLRFSKRGLSTLLSNGYWEIGLSDAAIARGMKERLEVERTSHGASRFRELPVDKEERISKALVGWFLTTNRLTLDHKSLSAGSQEAVKEFKTKMRQAGLELPANDEELHEYFGDVIIEMDMPPEL